MLDQLSGESLLIIDGILALIALGLAAYASYAILRLRRLRKNFMLQNQPVDLEEILGGLATKIRDLERGHLAMEAMIKELQHHLQLPIQKVGVVRFNSLSNEGGNLSFSLALLDSNNNGITLTSMHARDHNRIYTKIISGGVSEVQLTEEEIQAMTTAQSRWQSQLNKDNQANKTASSPKRRKAINK